MKTKFYLPFFLICCICISLISLPVHAEPDSTPDLTGGMITGFRFERVYASYPKYQYPLNNLDELSDTISYINESLEGTVLLPDGEIYQYALCTASWNLSPSDITEPGDYDLTASLYPPDGCSFAQGVRRQIVIPVRIIDPESSDIIIETFNPWPENVLSLAIETGDDLMSLYGNDLSVINELKCYDSEGVSYHSYIQWNPQDIDAGTPGVYRMSGTLIPPTGCSFSDNLTLPEPYVYVSVQEPERPVINCFYTRSGSIIFPWVTPPGSLDEIKIWISEEMSGWTRLENGIAITENSLRIQADQFINGRKYQIQMDYHGGQTGIFSFWIDKTMLDTNYRQGDRDGSLDKPLFPPSEDKQPSSAPENPASKQPNGDSDVTLPPTAQYPVSPKAPSDEENKQNAENKQDDAPSEAAPTTGENIGNMEDNNQNPSSGSIEFPDNSITLPSGPIEFSDDGITSLSGERLKLMMQDASFVSFSKHGITASISSKALHGLHIQDADQITVLLEKYNDEEFSFLFYQNENPVSQLPGTILMVPYYDDLTGEDLWITDESKKKTAADTYDKDLSVASFTVDTTGRFILVKTDSIRTDIETQSPNIDEDTQIPSLLTEQSKKISILSVILILTLASGLLIVLLRKKQSHQE